MGVILQPGDIVCFRGHNFGSRVIRFFTRTIGEPRTKVNHIAIVTRGGTLKEAEVTEALHTVKRRNLWKWRADGKTDVAVFRNERFTLLQGAALAAEAEKHIGEKYAYSKLVLQFLDWLCFGVYFWRRLGGLDRRPICSWLAAFVYWKLYRMRFGGPYEQVSPDDMWDWMNGRRDGWKLIRPLEPL